MALTDDVLFIFLDESGNFDFSPKGSKYWSLTALCTLKPIEERHFFLELLYELGAAGGGQEYFHATEDLQSVRDQVFSRINALPQSFEIHSVIAEKCKCNPSLFRDTIYKKGKWVDEFDPSRFYETVGRTLLKYIFRRPKYKHASRIVIVLSAIFNNPRHQTIKKTLQEYLQDHTKAKFYIYFHGTKADLNCQIADYCGWAIARKWEMSDRRSYDLIKHHIKSEFDIFAIGTTKYY